jgi:hypothetical protein
MRQKARTVPLGLPLSVQPKRGRARSSIWLEKGVAPIMGKVRKGSLLLAAGLAGLLLVWVVLAPAETRLGNLVKLVYVHGALVWVGLVMFSVAGGLGVAALAMRHLLGWADRANAWYRGTDAAGKAALIVWVAYALSAMIVTGLAWGQVIAWNEPRVRVTGLILVAAVVVAIVTRLVDHNDFTAVVNIVMGIVPWIVVRQAEAIRHPVDPIGGSESAAIQVYYVLIVLTVGGLAAALVAWLWAGAELKARRG